MCSESGWKIVILMIFSSILTNDIWWLCTRIWRKISTYCILNYGITIYIWRCTSLKRCCCHSYGSWSWECLVVAKIELVISHRYLVEMLASWRSLKLDWVMMLACVLYMRRLLNMHMHWVRMLRGWMNNWMVNLLNTWLNRNCWLNWTKIPWWWWDNYSGFNRFF